MRQPSKSRSLSDVQLQSYISKVIDFSDVIALADPSAQGFRLVTEDKANSIRMFSKNIQTSPIHMMKAQAIMPCSPSDFMRYLDLDIRALWDDHFLSGEIVGSSSTAKDGSLVTMKHIAFVSPLPFLNNRDFELITSERVDAKTGVAMLKAFSLPRGSIKSVTADVVRAVIEIAGFVASPIQSPDGSREKQWSEVTYVALVSPGGRIPPMVVNVVIGKQTSGLRGLQEFISSHPLSQLGNIGSGNTKEKATRLMALRSKI